MNNKDKKIIKEKLFNKYSIIINSFKKNKSSNLNYSLKGTLFGVNIDLFINNLTYTDPKKYLIYINNNSIYSELESFKKYTPNKIYENTVIGDFLNSISNLNSTLMLFSLFKYNKGDYLDYFKIRYYSTTLESYDISSSEFEEKHKLVFSIHVFGLEKSTLYYIKHTKDETSYTICKDQNESKEIFSKNLNPLINSILQCTESILNLSITGDWYDLSNYSINSLDEISDIIDTEYKLKSIVKY